MIKIATVTPIWAPFLFELGKEYIEKAFEGEEITITPYYEECGTLLDEIKQCGEMKPEHARRAFNVLERAQQDGNDAILVECSTMGDVSKCAKQLYELMGTPLVRIDQPAFTKAVSIGNRIGMVVNLSTTIPMSSRLAYDCAKEQGKEIELVLGYEEAYGMSPEEVRQSMLKNCKAIENKVDVIVLAQATMTVHAEWLQSQLSVPVIPTVPMGVEALRNAVIKK